MVILSANARMILTLKRAWSLILPTRIGLECATKGIQQIMWVPRRNCTNDGPSTDVARFGSHTGTVQTIPSNAVANAKGSLVAKLVKPMRMIELEAENVDLHMQLKAAAKKIEELEAAAAASKKIEELKAAAKKIEERSVHFSVMQVPSSWLLLCLSL